MNRRTALTTIAAALGLPSLLKALRPTPAPVELAVPYVADGPVEIFEWSTDGGRTWQRGQLPAIDGDVLLEIHARPVRTRA